MPKKQISARVDEQVVERVKDIVFWNPEVSFSGLVEKLLKQVVEQYGSIKRRPDKNLTPGRSVNQRSPE